jgi:hypothetical protein
MKRHYAFAILTLLVGCSAHGTRGIADRRSDFRKFLPMTGESSRYGLKAVKPYFQRANRAQILRAIEGACLDHRKRGGSFFNPETRSGYYVNCNPENRQLLNGYIPANPSEAPRSGHDHE